MPATAPRNTKRRDASLVAHLVHLAAVIYAGTMVALRTADGAAVPAGTAASGNCVGVAEESVTGDGTNTVRCAIGKAFHFANSAGGDEIVRADIGGIAYVVDDETVAKTDDGGDRVIAGSIVDVDAAGVWVLVGPGAVGPEGPAGA